MRSSQNFPTKLSEKPRRRLERSALRTPEKALLGPLRTPYSGRIRAPSVARTLFGQFHKRSSQKFVPPPFVLRKEPRPRSEEHTSELQSRQYLVCRLLLEKKKKIS